MGGAGKSKPTFICPFFYHLYESQGLLTDEEETDCWAAQELTRYRITLDRDAESEPESEGVKIITTPASTLQKPAVVPVNQVKQGKRLKQTYMAPKGSPPVRSKGEGSRPQSKRSQPDAPQPNSQPEPSQPERPEEEEEERPWVHKPFTTVVASYR